MERQTGRFAEGRGERERGGERGVEAAVSDVAEEAAETLRKKAGKGRTRRAAREEPARGDDGVVAGIEAELGEERGLERRPTLA